MRLYRALLRLYPASFRREFGSEMEAVFASRLADADGPLARTWLWLETMADVARNAAVAHWDILRQDLRYIARTLRRAPGFTLTAILVTALGVGANAAAFSVTDFVLVRPLPFPEPDRLVRLWQDQPGYPQMEPSPGNYRDWKVMSSSFESMAAYSSISINVVGAGDPERVEGATAEPELFPMLGTGARLGRTFTEEDARKSGTVILSDGYWRTRMGADPSVIGRKLTFDGTPYEIIGVMPPDFVFPNRRTQLWTPLYLTEANYQQRADNWLWVIARLKPGTTVAQARADLGVIAKRLEQLYPEFNRETGASVNLLREELSGRSRLLLLALSGASLCILLIACANLGNLLLARGVARERELAVRTALGAGRERLVRQLITESLALAALGGALGLAIAVAAVPLLGRLVPNDLPFGGTPTLNLRVLTIAGTLTLITGLLFAVLPTLRARGGRNLEALREGSRAGGGRKERLRATLVTIEIGASVVLLIASGLLMRAIQRIQKVDPGFRTERLLTLRTALSQPKYARVVDRDRFYARVLADVRAIPGVTEAAFISGLPFVWGGGIWPITVNGEPEVRQGSNTASMRFITPGYFRTLGIPLRAGRELDQRDRQDAPFVAVISQSLARRHWPNEDPIGKRFKMATKEREVVGVVADVLVRGLERINEPQVYLPAPQVADSWFVFYAPKDLVIASSLSEAALAPAVTRIVHAVDPEQPVSDVRSMTELMTEQTASRATQLRVLAALAVIALLLSGIGIHGLLSFIVSQRAQEIGVRMALGAQASSMLSSVIGRGLWLTLTGLIPGAFVAYLAGRGMQAVLFGVPPTDTVTFAVVIGLCLAMALAGCIVPALRAIRTDPIRVMRAE